MELPGPDPKAYAKLFQKVHADMTATEMMSKYHNLGTPGNVIPLNELSSLPIVITSYSIHYTKLYDPAACRRR